MLKRTVEARILAAMNFEEPDRVPIWDYLDNRGIVTYLAPGIADYGEAMVQVYHKLGIDLCRGFGGSFGEEDEGRKVQDQHGDVTAQVSGRTQWKVKYEISSFEALKNYTCPLPTEDEKQQWLEDTKKNQEMFAPWTMFVPGHGCGFHAAYGMMGVTFFSLAMYDYREEVERVIFEISRRAAEFAKVAARANLCPLFFIGDDIAYKERLLYSPDFLRATFIPALQRCCEPLNNAGIKVIFHSDGYVMEILDDMIEAGISGLNPIEPAAGMDIGLIKQRYGQRLILSGNVDCSQVLPLGSVADVIAATKECLRLAAPGGGHFIGSSSEITPATPVENILAFYQTCHEAGKYPIRL